MPVTSYGTSKTFEFVSRSSVIIRGSLIIFAIQTEKSSYLSLLELISSDRLGVGGVGGGAMMCTENCHWGCMSMSLTLSRSSIRHSRCPVNHIMRFSVDYKRVRILLQTLRTQQQQWLTLPDSITFTHQRLTTHKDVCGYGCVALEGVQLLLQGTINQFN